MAKKFTKNELENIIKDYNNGNGLRPFELAQKYNRNSGTIIYKLKNLGIYKDLNYRFTNEDIDFLKINYPLGNWKVIFERLPKVSKQSIQTKMSKLGIKQNNESVWTVQEIEILKKYYIDDIEKIQKLLPTRSYHSIHSKAQKLGIKNREFWTKEEKEKLIQLYPNYSVDEVLTYFPNRSRYSIIHEAKKLDLQSYDYNPYTKEEDDYIINNWELKPDIVMGKDLGRTQGSIKVRRHFLKLYRRNMDNLTYENLSKYIRGNIQSWKNKSMKNCDYKCIFTGSKDFQIHHLYGVSNLLNDIIKKYNFNIYENFNEYTEYELNDILEAFIVEQDKYPLGVCISKNIHVLFHSLYGQYYNIPEQWYQFERDFNAGIYNEIILNKTA
jgi:hypothetical protein